MVRSLASAEPAARPARLAGHWAASLDAETLGARLAEAQRATWALGWVCDLQAASVFLVVPALGFWAGAERALFVSLPVLGAVHAVAVWLAFRCHRRLFPDQRRERGEELAMAALYPPALLRLPQRWVDAAVAGFHPLALARSVWPAEAWHEAWCRELAWLALREPWRGPERAALLQAAPPEVRDAPPRPQRDPTAASYCPVCLDDFRPGFERCRACQATTVVYPATA